ncbi:peptide-methionine (R)-S-oxide reductase MsrB [Pontimonas sp.]|jgi:peptide-methionine (R)-S-oxide reductase|uniref:peptide-methionine (R)-S-oxide reductase MsrB n=1 Tax=Pontimonas sp. TaxID=2304492 RepID=UPI002870A325|nr:peptide-methionine (R)-S-oxide reductase MsrB [Pontimonas sp.]MDR9397233.1 peptide-methionine (R)-S-oxide reductase MsrB [Pontimonas sp.]MDR9435080.1 peptide-methionine (R)-S-oxide reductase MsrB [Pontimonas sp.]
MSYPISKDNDTWKAELPAEKFHVLRQAGTERPWSGELLEEKRPGVFHCGACGADLFSSDTKFESGSGWPSFWDAVNPDAVELKEDRGLGMVRTEVLCAQCGSHLGHLFDDAVGTPTGQRYCMNSLAMDFTPKD